ncbi:M20 family metallopeptidase [Sediminibacillus sp. JSM 1682029]|uniref:M20 metallopeptidase family protein n=1 Tax=Sediminibacillus sp. JSM 1682029 TaxID=3229857 RepID=UPI0035261D44
MSVEEQLIKTRRSLHQIPEVAGEEVKTREFIRSFIFQETNNIQIDYDNEFGIIAKYHYHRKAPTIAFRAEMDGLPLQDKKECSYQSVHKGNNHACGHDAHMAIILHLLNHVDQSDYSINILFIFQSSEEVFAGAKRLIQPLLSYSIDYLFALHVTPNLYARYFSLSSDVMLAANYSLELTLKLTSGHVAGKADLMALLASIYRFQEGYCNESQSVKVTKIETNGYYNINPSTVKLFVNFRGKNKDINHEGFAAFLEHIISKHDRVISVEHRTVSDYPSLKNDERLNQIASEIFKKKFGAEFVLPCPFIMSSDDFAFYSNELTNVKCCYYFIGSYMGDDIDVHTERFDIDENCLYYGYESFKAIVEVLSKSSERHLQSRIEN